MLAPAANLLKKAQRRLWMKYALTRTRGVDARAGYELAYRIRDPWDMDSTLERTRFEATNRLIERHLGPVDTLLEVGCGEGHQSQYLAQACNRLHGIDVSPQAVAGARDRLPEARFEVADIQTQPWGTGRHAFDLVTACEMLYCLPDPTPVLGQMQHLGRRGLVTFFSPACRRLQSCLVDIPGLQRDWICCGGTVWLVAWWRHD